MAELELKPCPFCGESDEWNLSIIPIQRSSFMKQKFINVYIAMCDTCKCRTEEKDTPEDAAEAWNRRG